MTFTVGLTGGTGSGKTTVATLFTSLGIDVIDADAIAKTCVAFSQPAFHSIVDHFGADVLHSPTELDRMTLREIIFNHPSERLWLEKLLHPVIIEEIQKKCLTSHSPYLVLMVPLLLETQYPLPVDRVLVVDVPPALQIQRIASRDKISHDLIEKMLAAQLPREARLAQANDILTNDRDLPHLEQQVQALHQQYLALAKNR